MLPSEIITWECGSGSYTNNGSEPCPCLMCHTKHPKRYTIVAGATAAATAGQRYSIAASRLVLLLWLLMLLLMQLWLQQQG
jgi:hypothetical protein